jgi:DnaJ-class molecular chaperone
MAKNDYYGELGLDRADSAAAVKAAYRRLAKALHPDVNPGNPLAEASFKKLGEAYCTLHDEEKRAAYDRMLDVAAGQAWTSGSELFASAVFAWAAWPLAAACMLSGAAQAWRRPAAGPPGR